MTTDSYDMICTNLETSSTTHAFFSVFFRSTFCSLKGSWISKQTVTCSQLHEPFSCVIKSISPDITSIAFSQVFNAVTHITTLIRTRFERAQANQNDQDLILVWRFVIMESLCKNGFHKSLVRRKLQQYEEPVANIIYTTSANWNGWRVLAVLLECRPTLT